MFHSEANRQVAFPAILIWAAAQQHVVGVTEDSEFGAHQDTAAEKIAREDIDHVRLFERIRERQEIAERDKERMMKYRNGQE